MKNKKILTRLMEASEAHKLQQLLQRCYGDSYFDALYYDEAALKQAITSNQQCSWVAVNDADEFVAHIGLRNYRNSLTADTTLAIVDPAYRLQGLFVEIGAQMMPVYRQLNLSGLYLQSVTVHPYTQNSSLKGGAGVTGIYLNYIPAATRFLEVESFISSIATPAVIMVQPLAAMPLRSIVWPNYYRLQIQAAFEQCNILREAIVGQSVAKHSLIRIEKKLRQKIAVLWVEAIADDWVAEFEAAVNSLDNADYNAVYLQLPLNQYSVDKCIEVAKTAGFFYAGVLPEYAKQDWLSLQRVDRSGVDTDTIHIVGDESRKLFEFILAD